LTLPVGTLDQRDPLTRWSCPFYDTLLQETWEDEHFVLNPRSGETHVLNGLTAAILSALAEAPISLDELVERFGPALGGATDEAPEQILDTLLSQLDQLGLIDPALHEDR